MVTTLDYGIRKARKPYRCGMCLARINPGDAHAYQVTAYDGRVYTWRDCLPCDRDGILNYVHDFTGSYHDEGVDFEAAIEWAQDAARWPRYWIYGRQIGGHERLAARNWLARATGDE